MKNKSPAKRKAARMARGKPRTAPVASKPPKAAPITLEAIEKRLRARGKGGITPKEARWLVQEVRYAYAAVEGVARLRLRIAAQGTRINEISRFNADLTESLSNERARWTELATENKNLRGGADLQYRHIVNLGGALAKLREFAFSQVDKRWELLTRVLAALQSGQTRLRAAGRHEAADEFRGLEFVLFH